MPILKFLRLKNIPYDRAWDDPETSRIHREIITQKPFLKALYLDLYREMKRCLAGIDPACLVELGSGAGFIKEVIPSVLTSDIFVADWLGRTFSADKIPFEKSTVDAFLMLDVFHHLPNIEECLREMSRCLKPGGKIVMIEPANTPWQRFISRHFNHERFDVQGGWNLSGEGRLSAGNGALPWIVFVRDREIFKERFPRLEVRNIRLHTPFRYVLSGGLSYRSLMPFFLYPFVKGVEYLLSPLNKLIGYFQTIEVVKKP